MYRVQKQYSEATSPSPLALPASFDREIDIRTQNDRKMDRVREEGRKEREREKNRKKKEREKEKPREVFTDSYK